MLFDNIPINTGMIISFLFALWYYKNVENKIYNCTIYTDILTILSTIIIFSNFKNNSNIVNFHFTFLCTFHIYHLILTTSL